MSGLFLHWNIFVKEYYIGATAIPWIIYGKSYSDYQVIGMGRVSLGVTPIVLTALLSMCIVAAIALYMSVNRRRTIQ